MQSTCEDGEPFVESGRSENRPDYEVSYTSNVVEFILETVWSKRVYEKIDSYRQLLASFPDIGTPYRPIYPAARPPFPCRYIPVPDTPFTLYYLKDDDERKVVVFFIEHQASDPRERFSWASVTF